MELGKNLEINELISLYGALLNKKQLQVLQDYYFYDCSLSEIAENMQVSRQAVSDLIKRVVKTLYKYEASLKLQQKNRKVNAVLNVMQQNNAYNLKTDIQNIKNILEE